VAPPLALRWSELAQADLQAAWDFIARDNEAAADALIGRILGSAEALERHPQMGRTGRIPGTRELVIPATPFILAYRAQSQRGIVVLAIVHGARKWPERL
jgi:toxin ParE1/3/4